MNHFERVASLFKYLTNGPEYVRVDGGPENFYIHKDRALVICKRAVAYAPTSEETMGVIVLDDEIPVQLIYKWIPEFTGYWDESGKVNPDFALKSSTT